jgi:uncharacterized protein (DUF58 family)
MPLRRRAWLTREGWYYLAVLGFVIGGAVLRSVNLLVVLAGMMIAPLLFNWRLVMASLMGLAVRRQLPRLIVAGEPLTVAIVAENPRPWMSSWLLKVEDWIEREGGRRPIRALQAAATIVHVPARGRGAGVYRLLLQRRGVYRFGPLRVSTRFPLGLVRGHITLPSYDELTVAPRLGRLLPAWGELLEAEQVGDERRHPERGASEDDYYGLRPWQSGDSLRWIHWRTTAKLARPIVRQYERQKSRDVALILDPWLSAASTEEAQGSVEMAISLAATAIADIASRGHSRLTVVISSRPPQCHSGPATSVFCQELLAHLARLTPESAASPAVAIEQAQQAAPRGARLIVISSRGANDPSLADEAAELAVDPDQLLWIDVRSEQLPQLFTLE